MGPICDRCYPEIRGTPLICLNCGRSEPLVALSTEGLRICGPCVGFTVNYCCGTCGVTANLYERGRCDRCVMIERVQDLLTGPAGEISPALRKLAETFEAADKPRSVLRWLQRSAGARLLSGLAATNSEITHATLDALPQTKYLHHVRQALVHVGILPERIEYLDRIGPWIDDLLAGYPADDANLVRTYAHWYVLRRARQRTRRHDSPTMLAAGHAW